MRRARALDRFFGHLGHLRKYQKLTPYFFGHLRRCLGHLRLNAGWKAPEPPFRRRRQGIVGAGAFDHLRLQRRVEVRRAALNHKNIFVIPAKTGFVALVQETGFSEGRRDANELAAAGRQGGAQGSDGFDSGFELSSSCQS